MTSQKLVDDLTARFERNKESYFSSQFNEAQARQEFINPLFRSLGWDIDNEQGYAEAYKDVIHEDALKIGGATKAPDYCFRIGGNRKFFLEAKKPAINVKEGIDPAFQLRRYAWSAKLPLSILTNFEVFSVYDCRIKPDKNDPASTARVICLNYQEYATRWGEISSIFSREAVLRGSFDRFAEETNAKKGTAEVDDAFLEEIESWRDSLARNIALRNPSLTQRELNFAVQRIIDRIIFLRICEDRGIEDYGRLMALQNGTEVYGRLRELFYRADERYNSGLFHFQAERGRREEPDALTSRLKIDDKTLKEIIQSLYYPDSPYEFSVLPADILGHVYEQFLGKVIRFTPGHRAIVENKPEVKKSGGVYYTPTAIVDFIVTQTIGQLCKGRTPKQVSKLRILDPACGSGSFLLGGYQYLLDWHRDYYEKDPSRWATGRFPALYQASGGIWRLTTAERKRILLNNIYGVDLDSQAVEVTKLSLLLKVLEDESEESLIKQLEMYHVRALPDLGNNIKCGNSLIGYDFDFGHQKSLYDEEDEAFDVNPFDWNQEFADVFNEGGFSVVIGNPPYLFITELHDSEKRYFFNSFKTSEYRFDVYGLFIESAITRLLQSGGYLSFITPHTLLSNDSFQKLRKMILQGTYLEQVVDIGPGVFKGAKNETMIFVARKGIAPKSRDATVVISTTAKAFPCAAKKFSIKQDVWMKNPAATWLVRVSHPEMRVVKKLEKCEAKLGDLCTINQGLRTGDNGKYLSRKPRSGKWKHAAGGKQVGRYQPLPEGLYVYYEPHILDAPRSRKIFESPEKLVIQEIRNITLPRRLVATYDDAQYYCLQSTNVINIRENDSVWHIKYLLGIVNSNAANFFFRQRYAGNNHIASNQLAQIPIPIVTSAQQEKVVLVVDRMLSFHEKMFVARTDQERIVLQRQLAATDEQIDRLVYALFQLSPEEILLMERSKCDLEETYKHPRAQG